MGVRLRSRDQTAKCGMAHEKFSSEESTHEQIQVENYDCFFSTAVALCTKNLYLQDRQFIKPSTKMSWNDFKNGSSEPEGTLQTIGCCNTIRASSNCTFNSRISGEEKHSHTCTSSLHPRSSSVRFLPLP